MRGPPAIECFATAGSQGREPTGGLQPKEPVRFPAGSAEYRKVLQVRMPCLAAGAWAGHSLEPAGGDPSSNVWENPTSRSCKPLRWPKQGGNHLREYPTRESEISGLTLTSVFRVSI